MNHILSISWQDLVSNDRVLEMVEDERALMMVVRERHKRWLGHILRGNSLLKLAIEGRYVGKPKRGRKCEMFINYLQGDEPYHVLKRRAENREEWRHWSPS